MYNTRTSNACKTHTTNFHPWKYFEKTITQVFVASFMSVEKYASLDTVLLFDTCTRAYITQYKKNIYKNVYTYEPRCEWHANFSPFAKKAPVMCSRQIESFSARLGAFFSGGSLSIYLAGVCVAFEGVFVFYYAFFRYLFWRVVFKKKRSGSLPTMDE